MLIYFKISINLSIYKSHTNLRRFVDAVGVSAARWNNLGGGLCDRLGLYTFSGGLVQN